MGYKWAEKRHVVQKGFRLAVLLVLFTALAVGMTGCKDSDVLNELIEDQLIGELDPDFEPLYKEVAGAPEDPTRTSTFQSENDNYSQQENTESVYDEEPNQDDEAAQREQQESSDTYDATQGNEPNPDADTDTSNGDAEGEGPPSPSGEGEDGEKETGDTPQPNNSDGGSGGPGLVVDTNSNPETLPDAGYIATAGPYATIVQMLAGKGGLSAADESWKATVQEKGVFPGEGVESLATGWSGDGSAAGSANVDAIINSGANCVLTGATNAVLSADDAARLAEAGISVVTMPELGSADTPDANITSAVQYVARMLTASTQSGNTQYDATAMAEAYQSRHDEALNNCVNSNGGYSYKVSAGQSYGFIYQGISDSGIATTSLSNVRITTAFIDSWTAVGVETVASQRIFGSASMSYLADEGTVLDCSDGVGLSVPGLSSNFVLMDYYLQCSGVVNNAYENVKPAVGVDNALPSVVAPGGYEGMGLESSTVARQAPSGLWYSPSGSALSSSSWLTVGDTSSFPGIIVRSTDIANKVCASAAKSTGYYNVGQPYYVYVMPSGLDGSWADGTVESFLVAPWTYGTFHGNNLSTCTTYVNSFYSTFYRCSNPAAAVQDYGTTVVAG